MRRIAKFFKVSFEQFKIDMIESLWTDPTINDKDHLLEIYKGIKIPERATMHSAGYDFRSPVGFTLAPGQTVKIPTGTRVKMNDGWVLKLYPRSGLGFKYRLGLDNTVGIIDSDYFYSDNDGHIMAKITNNSNDGKILKINPGDRFMQGVFVEYGITEDDNVQAVRNGGFGSTN